MSEIKNSFSWAKIFRERYPSVCLILLTCFLSFSLFSGEPEDSEQENMAVALGWEPMRGGVACDFAQGQGFYVVTSEELSLEVFVRSDGQVLAPNTVSEIEIGEPKCQKISKPHQIEELYL